MSDPTVEENTTVTEEDIEAIDVIPEIDDSEFDLDPVTEAEIFGNQAYALIVSWNQTKMTAKATKSVNGKQYDDLMLEMARMRNQVAYIKKYHPRAMQVKNRIAKEDVLKFSKY